ncbi:MAG: hypothetical protein KDK70_43485, partial [Myxococcales bacterium]|nr:hypothetical protein [Myxococcales bacterium]
NDSPPDPPPASEVWPPERFEGVWHMDVSGMTIADSVADAHPAMAETDDASAQSQRGIAGLAAEFDGNNDVHNAGDPQDGSLDAGNDSFTVSLWARVESNAGSYDTPLYKGAAQDFEPGYGFFFGALHPSLAGCIADDEDRQHLPYGPLDALLGGWHHFVLTVNRERQTVTAYLDGVEVSEEGLMMEALDSDDALTFSDATNPFRGLLDEIRVQRAAVDAAWVAAEWTNLADRSAFFTVGPPETSP